MCHDELFHVLLIAGKKKTCLRWLCFLSIPAEQHLPNEVICFMCHCQKFWQCPPVSPRPGVNLITITITGLLISWGRCLWSEYGWHLLDEKKTHTHCVENSVIVLPSSWKVVYTSPTWPEVQQDRLRLELCDLSELLLASLFFRLQGDLPVL